MSRRAWIAIAVFGTALVPLLALHRDLGITLGNSEWDYIAQVYNQWEGVLDRTSSLRDAFRPDGVYGQGYAIAAWAARRGLGLVGFEPDAFRAGQLVTAAFSLFFLLGTLRLGRTFGLPRERDWIPVAGLACVWPFLNLAAQVTTDVVAAALVALAMVPLFRAPSPRGGVVAGLLLGLGFLVRANVLAYLPLFVAMGVLLPANPVSPRTRLAFAVAMAAGFAAAAAPRLAADYIQTGRLIYHDQGRLLRAVLYDGGTDAYHLEPATVLEVIARDPTRYAAAYARSYVSYESVFLPLLAPAFWVLLRDSDTRRRGAVALLLVLGLPLGPATHPYHAFRYVLPVFPLAIVLVAAALERALPSRARALLPKVALAAMVPLFLFEIGLLVDKYHHDLPAAEIASQVNVAAGRGAHVLLRTAGPSDEIIYAAAVRYRLRRLGLPLTEAPRPIDLAGLRRLAFTSPVFILRVPIPDTGPSVLFDLLRGRRRHVLEPTADPVLAGVRPELHDPVSGVELYRIEPPR